MNGYQNAEKDQWLLQKFGGTSVGSSDCIREVIDIIRPLCQGSERIACVVSAMGGKPKVTDLLLDSVHAAAGNELKVLDEKLTFIKNKHRNCINDLFKNNIANGERIFNEIEADINEIVVLLKAVTMMRFAHEQILELVSGYGEIWSAKIITQACCEQGLNFVFVNARDVLFVTEDEAGTKVCWDESQLKLDAMLTKLSLDNPDKPKPNLLITGYVASTMEGIATTLKRDGSDFSASIFGKMLSAKSVTIWTDVSGVYSADPRLVPEAQIISDISYNEAIELAYFGAKVIHPKTMAPAIMDSIPIYIRNTFRPQDNGTKISVSVPANLDGKNVRNTSVCGFSSVNNIALLNMEGAGMAGVTGVAHRLFGALKASNISVMMIAQASSEHSICFAIKEDDCDCACRVIKEAFFYEFNQEIVNNLSIIRNCSMLAAIGESMSNVPGVSGLFFGALGNANINILSISQGCDERNISAVVSSADIMKALRAVHSAFWLSSLSISIGIVGTGRIGSALIQSLLEQAEILERRFQITLKIRGVINSRKMLLEEDLSQLLSSKLRIVSKDSETNLASLVSDIESEPLSPGRINRAYSNTSLHEIESTVMEQSVGQSPSDINAFLEHICNGSTPHSIIIDCTTSKSIADMHPIWLNKGAHIVTANKRAISQSLNLYNLVYNAVRTKRRMYMSEVTIGASIPIKTTLNDILLSGDAISSIIGLMSVSVNTVLSNMCDRGMSFSESVQTTYNSGLFESSVFEDLDGTEAAQKLLILAREIGIPLSIEDVEVDSLAFFRPVENWKTLCEDGIFAEEDAIMKEKVAIAKKRGCTLKFIQRISLNPPVELGSNQKVTARVRTKLEEVSLDSKYAEISGPVYYFAFHTARYSQSPLIIQGPLSDSMNTASGMVGDILRIARSIGARDTGPEVFKTKS